MNNVRIFLNAGLSNELEMTKANGYLISLPTNQLFKRDETLDEANFEFYSSIEENIKPFTRFKIVKEQTSNTETKYYYGYSETETINLKKGIYKHYVYLIEPTKILERHILGTRYFSKDSSFFTTYTDLVNLILETCYTTSTAIAETSPIDNFYFDNESDERLLETAREYQFSDTTTLFEALEEIALSLNAYPRVVDFDKIIFDFFEDGEDKTIDSEKIFNEKTTQDMNRYSTALYSTIKNVISSNQTSNIKFPNELGLSGNNQGIAERTESVRLTEDTAEIITEYPIYKIKKLQMVAGDGNNTADSDGFINNLRFIETGGATVDFGSLAPIDLTDFVFDKRDWDLFEDDLDNPAPYETVFDQVTGELTGENSKLCSLFYEEGDNKIQNLYNYNKFFFEILAGRGNIFNILTVKRKLLNKLNLPITSFADGVTPMFQIVYETMSDLPVRQYRNKYEGFGDGENNIIYNQGGNLIDFELFGENVKGKIKRMGNERYEVAFVATDYVDVNLGDKIGDYVVTEINKETYRKYEKILLKLDKNFNRKSNDVTIESQKRLFSIPNEQFRVERFIDRQHFISFSLDNQAPEYNNYTVLKREIQSEFTNKEKVSGVLYDIPTDNKQNIDVFHFFSKNLYRTPKIYTSENALIININFKDIRDFEYYSIKKKASMSDKDSRLETERTPNFYTDETGELENLNFAIGNIAGTTIDNVDFAYNYPNLSINPYYNLIGDVLKIKKDRREILNFSFQINYLSENKEIIITKNMAKLNRLIHKRATDTTKRNDGVSGKYIKIQPLLEKQNENYLTYDITKGEAENLVDGVTATGFSCIYNRDERKLEIIVPQSWKDTKSGFAFIDSEDNVIMIVNDVNVDDIFINYSNKY